MITVTGTFEAITGAKNGSVKFELVNFGTDVPRVSGTGVITNLSVVTALAATFSVSLFPNDGITPANTYYIATFYDANGNVVNEVPYTFNAGGPYDLSSTAPLTTIPPVSVGVILSNPSGQQTISAWQLNVVSLGLLGATSGTLQLLAAAVAGGAWTFRNTTDNVVGQNTTDTLANKTLSSPVINTPTLNGSGGALALPAGPDTLVGRATTDTLTNKTLTSPAISNPSTTGTDSGVETLQNKTLASPAISNPSTTGTDSGVETLKNKTLVGASMGNAVQMLNYQGNSGAITGNGAAQNVFSYTMPANTMQAGKGIRIIVFVQQNGTTNAAAMALNFGATNFSLGSFDSAGLRTGQYTIHIFNKPGVTNAQIITVTGFPGVNAFNSLSASSAIDTTGAVTITITFTVANTTTMTPILFLVEQIQ